MKTEQGASSTLPYRDALKPRSTVGHFLFAVCVPVFIAMIGAKAVAYGHWRLITVRFPLELAIVMLHDLLFVLAWAGAGGIVLTLLRHWPRASKVAAVAYIAASAFIVLYAMANIWLCTELRMPLTWPLLVMGGADARSSIAEHVTVPVVLSLVGGPLLLLIMVRWLLRANWTRSRRLHVILALVLVGYIPIATYGYNHYYAGTQYEALAANPHWVFVESCANFWRGEKSVRLGDPGPASFGEDFLTAADRPAAVSHAPHSPKIKNVVVVVLESVGTQFLSAYGSSYPTTPHLDAELSNSMVFRNVYSNAGYTLHSMMPLVLSTYPGTGFEIYASSHPHLAGTSPANALHDRGYRTAMMTGAALDFHGSRNFFDNRGFDVTWGFEDFQKMGVGTPVSVWGMDDPPLFDQLLKWISQEPGKPFFAIAWTQQTHHPYTRPASQELHSYINANDNSSRLLNLYLNNLHTADEQVGRLLAFLREKNLADSTLVVVTGDHGEAFGFPHRWRFHGTALYQESMNVPCIFWNPQLFAPGSRNDAVGAHVDLYPTVFDILQIPLPGNWQGRSLFDPRRPQRAYFSCNTGNLLEGLRDGNEKFIYNATLAREELYDLAADPTEQQNIAKEHPERCEQMRQRLSAWLAFEKTELARRVAAGGK